MASNSLTLRRTIHKRPIVCAKGPPPIPPVPPPIVECFIDPAIATVFVSSFFPNIVAANHEGLPLDDPVDVLYSATGGTFAGPPTTPNGQTTAANYSAPPSVGVYTLKAVFTFSDETICIAFATYTVQELM